MMAKKNSYPQRRVHSAGPVNTEERSWSNSQAVAEPGVVSCPESPRASCPPPSRLVAPAASQPADSFPNRTIKILVPYAPGGATDIIARIIAAKLTESLGQSVLVENRTGASGNLALEAVAKAPADGYTLFVGNVSTIRFNENTFAQQLQIKPSRDLVGIAKLVEIPHIIAVTESFPVNSVADLIALAKKDPGKINYASAGLGSYPHLDMEKLMKAAGFQMTHIPYKGERGR